MNKADFPNKAVALLCHTTALLVLEDPYSCVKCRIRFAALKGTGLVDSTGGGGGSEADYANLVAKWCCASASVSRHRQATTGRRCLGIRKHENTPEP